MEEAIKQLTGAAAVICIHHQVRNGGSKPDSAKVSVEPPAHAAHCDYTGHSGFQSFQIALNKLKNKDKNMDYSQGRYAMINAWRNISDIHPIYNDHLAVCDGRTVIAPDDFLKYDYITAIYQSESYYLSQQHQQFHKWYLFCIYCMSSI